jgi:hypothetical protein
VINQTRHTILKQKGGIYDPGKDFTKRWSAFNAERQATVIDSWFMGPEERNAYGLDDEGMSKRDMRFHYVRETIRPAKG